MTALRVHKGGLLARSLLPTRVNESGHGIDQIFANHKKSDGHRIKIINEAKFYTAGCRLSMFKCREAGTQASRRWILSHLGTLKNKNREGAFREDFNDLTSAIGDGNAFLSISCLNR